MTSHRGSHHPSLPSRPLLVAAAVLGLLLLGLPPASGEEETDAATIAWSDLGQEGSLTCVPERPVGGGELRCELTDAVGFASADVTFEVIRLLDEYDEGQLSELVQEETGSVTIDPDGDATLAFTVSPDARPDDVYDVALFGESTTACYAAVPYLGDGYDLEDGIFTILAGPGTLTIDDDGEGFAIDGEAFLLDDAEPICHYLVAWTGGEVGGTPEDDEPGTDDTTEDDVADGEDDPTEEAAGPGTASDDGTEETTTTEQPVVGTTLPRTGVAAVWWAVLGALLLVGGLALTLTGRRAG
jgi:hypothetical protein